MLVVGKESFQHASRFLKDIPANKRSRILIKLHASLLGVNDDPDIPKWIMDNYRHLSQDQADVVKQCQEVTQEFSYNLL